MPKLINLAMYRSASNILAMPISSTLRRASRIQEKIETLRGQLAGLLDKARTELMSDYAEENFRSPDRGARQKPVWQGNRVRSVRGRKTDGRAKASHGLKARHRSPLAGRKRAASPSGPLAPAVVRVLTQKNKPMNVRDILTQLLANGYVFNSSEPKKNLAARIYRLKGVKQVSTGLFAKA